MKPNRNHILNYRYFYYIIGIILVVSLLANILLCQRCYAKPTALAKVDTEFLIRNLVKGLADKNLNEAELQKATQQHIAKVDQLLFKIAEQEKLVILPSKAVIAGAIDITEQIQQVIGKMQDRQIEPADPQENEENKLINKLPGRY